MHQHLPSDDHSLLARQPFSAPSSTAGELTHVAQMHELIPRQPLDAFFEACGGVQKISLSARRIEDRGGGETYTFQQPFVVIGNCPECDLVIPDRSVNYRHIYLQLIGGQWQYTNLASISRTKAGNGQSSQGEFHLGCELKAGYYAITRVGSAAGEIVDIPSADQPPPQGDPPPFTLEFLERHRQSHTPPPVEFNSPITLIGTSRRCDMSVRDESVSRVHASLVATPQGLWVVDLVGRGGVTVDGRRDVFGRVQDGSVLQLGQISLRVRIGTPRSRSIARVGGRSVTIAPPTTVSVPGVHYGGFSEGAVLALMGQLAEMQNQFFEHSRMQMAWMSQMLAQVTESQRESAQRDMARIEEISRELRELRVQLAQPPAPPPPAPPIATVIPAVVPPLAVPIAAPLATPIAAPVAATAPLAPVVHTGSPAAVSGVPSPAATPPEPPHPTAAANGRDAVQPAPPQPPPGWAASSPGDMPSPAAGSAAAPAQSGKSTPGRNTAASERSPVTARASADTHAWLTQRMASLSQEQTSLWQRLMNTLTGNSR